MILIDAVKEPIDTPTLVQIGFNEEARFIASGYSRSAMFRNITCRIEPGIPRTKQITHNNRIPNHATWNIAFINNKQIRTVLLIIVSLVIPKRFAITPAHILPRINVIPISPNSHVKLVVLNPRTLVIMGRT